MILRTPYVELLGGFLWAPRREHKRGQEEPTIKTLPCTLSLLRKVYSSPSPLFITLFPFSSLFALQSQVSSYPFTLHCLNKLLALFWLVLPNSLIKARRTWNAFNWPFLKELPNNIYDRDHYPIYK